MLDRVSSPVHLAFAAALLLACSEQTKVTTTPNGTFDVPGAAQTKPGSLVMSTMESGCEIPGGSAALRLTGVKTKTDNGVSRTLFHVERTTCPAGWLDARFVYPVAAKPAE